MKNKVYIVLLSVILLLASCSGQVPIAETVQEATQSPTQEATAEPTAQPTETPQPTDTPEPQAKTPKYIFIVIGDGLGRGGMSMGEIYARIESGDMLKGAAWEDFDYQSYVTAMGESASGGTAIASGVETDPSSVGRDKEGNMLYTIMDRAKENGMATGVVTNSSLTDATPATFLGHTGNRYNSSSIAMEFSQSNVDYMAGGGLGGVVHEDMGDLFDNIDALGYTPNFQGPEAVLPTLFEMGYEAYLGLDGALKMKEQIANQSFTPEKSIGMYTNGIMTFEYYKYKDANSTLFDNVPNLIEMTEAGIQSLSQNENGFVMMIEEALIDKCGHKFNQQMYLYQVDLLNQLLNHLMEFYNEHPEETLIILTADHETGNYTYDDEKLNQWESLANFVWSDDSTELANYINTQWGLQSYDANLKTQMNIVNAHDFESDEKNRKPVYTAITLDVCKKYGTKITSENHSGQLVPLFVMGKENDAFHGITHIKEIPITLCEILGWKALPEIIDEK